MNSDPGAKPPTDAPADGLPGLSDDAFLDGRLVLRQPARGYRAGSDAVLLAAAAPAATGDAVLDAGCGVGTAGLCLLHRVAGTQLAGLDLQAPLIALAGHNAESNGLGARADFVAGDILAPPPGIAERTFDQVICNPPFYEAGRATRSPRESRDRAHVQGKADLAAWADFCLRRLRPGGALSLIVRTQSLSALLACLQPRAGTIVLLPLWPQAGVPAKRILVRARKGGQAGTELRPGLVLHETDGRPSAAAEEVLRHGAALPD